MDKLELAFGHLGNLSEEELRQHVRKVRKDRRTSKVRTSVRKAAVRKTVKVVDKVEGLLKGMTDEQKAALLKELEG